MRIAQPDRRRRPLGYLALLAALALMLTACPADDDTVAEPDPDEDVDVEEPEPEEEPDTDTEVAEQCDWVVGGSGTGGGAYIAGGTLAEWSGASDDMENISITNQSTAGFVENLRLLRTREIELGMGSTNLIHNAQEGIKAFEGEPGEEYEDIRALFPIWPQYGVAGTFHPEDEIGSI
jgi:uncharacterized protein